MPAIGFKKDACIGIDLEKVLLSVKNIITIIFIKTYIGRESYINFAVMFYITYYFYYMLHASITDRGYNEFCPFSWLLKMKIVLMNIIYKKQLFNIYSSQKGLKVKFICIINRCFIQLVFFAEHAITNGSFNNWMKFLPFSIFLVLCRSTLLYLI